MINIYQQPTEKNPTLGFTFLFFKNDMEFGVSYEKYPNVETAMHHFKEAKVDLLTTNLEAFWMYCDAFITSRNQIELESMKTLRDSVQSALADKDKYVKILSDIKEKANFMRTLVKAVPTEKDRKTIAIMMAASIQKFCKEELDEQQKNTG